MDYTVGTGMVAGMLAAITRGLAGPFGLAAWAAGLGIALGFSWRPATTPVVEDEVYWIGSAYYFHLAVLERDSANPDWRLLPAREKPPVSKFVIGAALAASGERVANPDLLASFYLLFAGVPGAWGGPEDRAKREAVVARMTPGASQSLQASGRVDLPLAWLKPARAAMLGCMVVTSLGVFLLARRLFGPWPALAAAAVLPAHPIASESLNHALADAPALMLSVLAAMALAPSLRSAGLKPRNSARMFGLAACSGALSGLACAAKMNALVIPLLAAAGFAVLLARAVVGSCPWREVAGCAFVFASASAAAFLAVNPALFGDWWEGIKATVLEHRRTGEIQAGFLTGRLGSARDRLEAIGLLLGAGRWAWVPLAGCATALWLTGSDRHRFVAGWWIIAWLAVTAWIPFLRLRYAAPLLIPSLLLIAGTVNWMIERRRGNFARSPLPGSRTS